MQAIFVQEFSRGLVWRCNCQDEDLESEMREAVASMQDSDQAVLAVQLTAFAQPEADVPLTLWLEARVVDAVEVKSGLGNPTRPGLFGGR